MIKALHSTDGTCDLKNFENIEAISDMIKDSHHLFWLDLDNPTEEELKKIGEEFHFHPLALEDAATPHERPKIDQYDEFFFLIFYALYLDPDKLRLSSAELKIFVGENYVVTVHYQPVKELEEAERRWRRLPAAKASHTSVILYVILDVLVDNYFPVVDGMAEWSDQLEEAIFGQNGMEANMLSNLLELKKMLLRVRRVVTPERDVINVLTNRDNPVFDEHSRPYFQDIFDHISRVSDTIDLYRDQLSSSMDANLTVASNDLNKVMRTLTATSIILMADSLIAGIYGMNFDFMPELHLQFGYFGALALMVGVTVFIYLFFKARRWF